MSSDTHTTKASGDFGDLIAEVRRAVKAIREEEKAMKATQKVATELVASKGRLSTSTKEMVNSLQQEKLTRREAEKLARRIAVAYREEAKAKNEVTAATKRAQAAQARDRTKGRQIGGYIQSLSGSVTEADLALQQRYKDQLATVYAEARKHKITLTQFKRLWEQVSAKGVSPTLTKYRELAVAMRTAVDMQNQFNKRIAAQDAAATFGHSMRPLMGTMQNDQKMFRDFNASISAAEAQITKAGMSSEQVRTTWNAIIEGKQIPEWGRSLVSPMRQLLQLSERAGYVWSTNQVTQEATARHIGVMGNLFKGLESNSRKTLVSWENIFRIVGSHIMYTGVSRMVGALSQSVRDMVTLQRRIAEIQTIDVSNIGFDSWLHQLRKLSDAFGTDILDQAEASYQALSNQITTGAQASMFMAEANKFAMTSVSTTAQSVNLLTASLNAYGQASVEAARTSAELFKVIELGRVRASEMQNTYGRVAIAAAQLGVAHSDLGAAISTLSIQGVNYNETATQLRGVMVALLKPTAEMSRFLQSIGVSTGEAAIAAYGFGGVIEKMGEYTKGSSTEMAKLIPRIRGISGAFAFSGRGMDIYRRNLQEIENAQDTYAQKTDIVWTNTGVRISREMNKLRNYMRVDFGNEMVMSFGRLINVIGGAENAIWVLDKAINFLGTTTIGIVGLKAVLGLNSALKNLTHTTNILAATKLAMPWVAGFAVGYAVTRLAVTRTISMMEGFQKQAEEMARVWTDAWKQMSESQSMYSARMLTDLQNTVDALIRESARINATGNEGFAQDLTGAMKALEKATTDFKFENSTTFRDAEQGVQKYETAVRNAESAVAALRSRLGTIRQGLMSKLFDWSLGDMPIDKQIDAIAGRINLIQRQSQAILNKQNLTEEDVSNFQFLRSELDRYFDQRRDLYRRALEMEKHGEEQLADIRTKRAAERQKHAKSLRDLEWERIKLGKDADPQRKFDLQVKENELILDHRQKLRDLQAEEAGIQRLAVKRIDYQREYLRLMRDEGTMLQRQAVMRQRMIQSQKEADGNRVTARVEFQRMSDTIRDLAKFDTNALAGVNTVEDLDEMLGKLVGRAQQAQKTYLGLTGKRYGELDDWVDAAKEAAALQRERIENTKEERTRSQDREEGNRRTQESIDLEKELNAELSEKLTLLTSIAGTLSQASKTGSTFQRAIADPVRPVGPTRGADVDLKALADAQRVLKLSRQVAPALAENIRSVTRALLTDPSSPEALTQLEDIQNRLQHIRDSFIDVSRIKDEQLSETVGQFQRQINVALEQIGQLGGEAQRLAEIRAKLKEVEDIGSTTARELGIELPDRSDEARRRINENVDWMIRKMNEYRGAIQGAGGALRNLPTGAGVSAGMAHGGILGTDVVPTMLTPGEFVVNRRAASQNFSQLVAMNNGMAQGGMTVGDIHVNLQSSGNAQYDAVEIGQAIRQEIRRGRIRW